MVSLFQHGWHFDAAPAQGATIFALDNTSTVTVFDKIRYRCHPTNLNTLVVLAVVER